MIILGTNSIKDTGYDVANSLRFNIGSTDYLNRTSGTSSNTNVWSLSMWIKRVKLDGGTSQKVFSAGSGSTDRTEIYFYNDKLNIYRNISGSEINIDTSMVFRDLSSWYHTLWVWNGTAITLYVNGASVTLSATNLGTNKINGSSTVHRIGIQHDNSSQNFGGYLAEVTFLDSTAVSDATSFGEFDEDSPTIWKPIDVSGLTFGNNGFYLDFEDSSALGNDVSGNNNDFTANNLTAIDQSTDTCTNNMPVFNSNDNQRQGFTFTEGNLKITATPSYDYVVATMGVSSGKWYWETKIITIPNLDYIYNGISDHNQYQADFDMGGEAGQYCLSRVAGKIKAASGSETTYGGSMVANDIQGFALDVDNLKLYISNNGQWSNGSGAWDSTTFNASTGAINIAYSTLPGGGTHWFPAIGNGSGNIGMEINFGSPVSAISSGNADGNGYGNMEFPIPSGYFCLNTKNLAEYG
jgi:hypothetical protein